MRKTGWRLVALAAVAVLSGCGQAACEQLAEAYADIERKSQPCLERAPLAAFSVDQCTRNVGQCSGEDLRQMEVQSECYRKLDTCSPERKDTFLEVLAACDGHALSNTCEAAIYQAHEGL